MPEIKLGTPAVNTEEYLQALVDLSQSEEPTVFTMTAKLPTQGRSDIPLGATGNMSVILKAYASGGENALHAHVREDHTFIILQGRATFYGIGNRTLAVLGRYQGILLPKGAYYRFEAGIEEQLVMLRVGAAEMFPDPVAAFARVDLDGNDLDGYAAENKEEPVRYDQEKWFRGGQV